jgi:hypothetical protein
VQRCWCTDAGAQHSAVPAASVPRKMYKAASCFLWFNMHVVSCCGIQQCARLAACTQGRSTVDAAGHAMWPAAGTTAAGCPHCRQALAHAHSPAALLRQIAAFALVKLFSSPPCHMTGCPRATLWAIQLVGPRQGALPSRLRTRTSCWP